MSVLKALSRRFLENPQLIVQSEFQKIAEILDYEHGREGLESLFPKKSLEVKFKEKMDDPFYSGYKFNSDDKTEESPKSYGVLKVEGALTYKPITSMCAPDTCNYQELYKASEKFISEGKDTIYFIHDSGGGEAYNMMETANAIRTLADQNNVKLIGYVDGLAASASYGLLSSCHEIIANPDARVGSIGVVVSLMNNSGALEKAGYKRSFITAGANKVPFDSEGEFTESFKENIQDDVNTLYKQFTEHVASYREGMSVDDVKSTEAGVFRAEEALKLGLIDKMMTVSEFKKEYLADGEISSTSKNTKSNYTKVNTMSEPQVAPEANVELSAVMAELEELRKFQASSILQTKKDAVSAKLAAADFLTNKEELTTYLASASEAESGIFFSTFEQFTAKTAQLQGEIATMAAEHTEVVAGFKTEIETMKTEHETFKEEFSKTESIKGQVDEKELSFEEKKARAVAQAVANKNK